jgi:transcriptional regulator with XRE-family HTH domain
MNAKVPPTNTRMRASDSLKAEFSKRLLRRLAEIGMNQSELAKKIGVTKDAVSTYARQRSLPTPATLRKMANILQMDPDALLPTRFEYEEALPLQIEMRSSGRCFISVALEVPAQVGIEIMTKLQPYATAANKRSG